MLGSKEIKSEFISFLMSGMSNCSLYSKNHPSVNEFAERALKSAEKIYIEDSLSITILGDVLLINNEPVRESSLHITNFIRRMRKKGIERIVMERGVDTGEIIDFLIAFSGPETIPSTGHISAGVIEVRLKDQGEDTGGLIKEGVERIKGSYSALSRFRKLDMIGLEEAIAGFIFSIKREGNILKLLSPVRSHSEYTYVHVTNVAILTIFQAQLMGLREMSFMMQVLQDCCMTLERHIFRKIFSTKRVALLRRSGMR